MANRKLGRTSSQRKAMLRDLTTDLIINERIVTTEARAKEIRKTTEKMITLGKRGDLASRRLAAQFVRNEVADVREEDEKIVVEDALQKLIKEGLPKEYSEGEFQDNVDWSNISLTDKQYKSKDGKRRQVFRHISDTNHDGKENDCFVWRTRIRGKRKGEKYKERVPCE